MINTKKYFILFLLALLLLSACHGNKEENYNELSDFEHATFGTFAGSPSEIVTDLHYPDANKLFFSSLTELALALDAEKIDGFILDRTFYQGIAWERNDFTYFDESLAKMDYSYGFAKSDLGNTLKGQMDEFILSLKDDGSLEALQKKWFSSQEPEVKLDFESLEDLNGTINVALSSDNKPYIYLKNNKYTGFEVELLYLFAKEYGYHLNLLEVNFNGALMGLETGKYDLVSFALNPTDEREENIQFSIPHMTSDMVLIVNRPEHIKRLETTQEFENATIGILTGSIYDTIAKEAFPQANLKYYSSLSDLLISNDQGKIDGFFTYTASLVSMQWAGASLKQVGPPFKSVDVSFGYTKENEKADFVIELNQFLKKAEEDGTLLKYQEKWLADQEPSEHPSYESLEDINGTLKVAVFDGGRPIAYLKDNRYTGYEIDLLTLFAQEYGYKLEFEALAFNGIIPGLVANKYDLAAANLAATEERKESISFSYPHIQSETLLVTIEDDLSETSFIDEFKEDFDKTFIREDRYKLILSGMAVTLLISLCATILGTLFGFMLYLLVESSHNIIAKPALLFAKLYSRIVAGTPAVVILMILFYVVFGSFRNISGIFVSILSFSFTFGSFVYNHMKVSVSSVDYGQKEAAHSLAYSKNKGFFKIILPQAMTIFMPSYCAQVVELIKGTAIVGYVAVNDLTKVGDIIRSNTYEAFFPLIATALIYFILTWIITLLLNQLKNHFNPYLRSKEKILKGIKSND